MSEQLQRPLYRLGINDLGTIVNQVEAKLQKALQRCARWGAVLLVDEADVFLERRSVDSLHRNELVSSNYNPLPTLLNSSESTY